MLAGMDRETGKPRGFAHVQFEDVEGAAAAIAKNGSELMGRDLFIDSAQERPQSGTTPGGRQQRGESYGSLDIPYYAHHTGLSIASSVATMARKLLGSLAMMCG